MNSGKKRGFGDGEGADFHEEDVRDREAHPRWQWGVVAVALPLLSSCDIWL